MQLEVISPKGIHTITVSGDRLNYKLTEILRREGLPLNTRCGERSLCDGCFIQLIAGCVVDVHKGKLTTGGGVDAPRYIRACDYCIGQDQTDVSIRIPPKTLASFEPKVLTDFRLNVQYAHDPLWQDDAAGVAQFFGAAIDIGTTTVVVALVDLATGEVVSRASGFNKQMHLADDVLSRINLCMTGGSNGEDMTAQMQNAVVEQTLRPLVIEALNAIDATEKQIKCYAVAANTTMLHLLAGVDPSSMGVVPFKPSFVEHKVITPGGIKLFDDVQMSVHENGDQPEIHMLPSAAAYVGADLVAGVFASGLAYDEGPSLLVDIGTNGEIILKHGDQLLGCATAAGPAFEGARLHSGIRAADGAISHIDFETDPFAVKHDMIGQCNPIGICGSAYIDFLAAARRINLLSSTGRIQSDAIPGAAEYITKIENYGQGVRFAPGRGNDDILITETDVASLLQAKAAIAAGILTLLEHVNIKPSDIKTLYLAGGFGMHVNIQNAIDCGLLPGFTTDHIELVGNTSLSGAYLSLMDRNVLDEMSRIASNMKVLELNLEPGFEMCYVEQLHLP